MSFKATFIIKSIVGIPITIIVLLYLSNEGLLTIVSGILAIVLTPVYGFMFVAMHRNNAEQYSVPSDERKQKDIEEAEKANRGNDT